MDLSFPHPTPAAPATLPAADARLLAASLGLWAPAAATAPEEGAPGAAADEVGAGVGAAGAFNPAMAARLVDWGET